MADQKEFDVIRVCRSDGADTGPGYWPATAPAAVKKPVAEKAPRAKPQMTRLEENDPRFVEWRIKLGILLKQEVSPAPDEGNPWYVPFPRGYWLYEKSKHLWVSGYPLKSKLFKTPQEFALHLIWLLSASKDYKDCSCVHCNPPSLPKQPSAEETPTLAVASPVKKEGAAQKITPVPLPQMPGQTNAPASSTPAVQRTQAGLRAASASPARQATPNNPPQQQTQPQPAQVWSLKSPILFRTGELVWFQQQQAWRLGIIASTIPSPQTEQQQISSYIILPIGHGMVQKPQETKSADSMRPFYAFSVPPATVPDLLHKTFDEIPWETMFRATGNDASKRDLLALDASKLAASKIDFSFSLWSPFPQGKEVNGITSYYGCFFGAERIEVGDSLRLRNLPAELNINSDTAILGLRHIYTTSNNPDQVLFRGHVYMLLKSDHPSALPPSSLPIALKDEIVWRNNTSKSVPWRFALVKENVALSEANIRGRFYPTHRLVPLLDPQRFQHAVQTGMMEDQLAHLNNRMDGQGRYIGRKGSRLESLGLSVGHGSQLGVEEYVQEEK